MKALRACFAAFTLMLIATPAFPDTRVALVIGNSNYSIGGKLPNPGGDAILVAETLKSDGFDVVLVQDANRSQMLDALDAFNEKADRADWALVYYAGHGIEISGVNYLLPVDVKLASDRKAQDEAVSLERVLSTVENAKKLRLVILDACRNNPFSASMKRSLATRSTVDRGLGRPDLQAAGVMVVYAAAAGQVAEDGVGDHSPFTAALVRRLQEPGLEVSRLFNVVTADVLEATGSHQRPFLYGSNPSREEFYFRLPASVPAPPGPRADEQLDQFWLLLKGSTDGRVLEQFKDRLPSSSPLRMEVETRLRELDAPATPPDKPSAGGAGATQSVAEVQVGRLEVPPDPSLMQCERLAASTVDPERPAGVQGVELQAIDAEAAVPACRLAFSLQPNNPRIAFMLARGLAKEGGSDAEAVALYRKAADAGNVLAMTNLGGMYQAGRGVAKDEVQAVALYRKAADAGESHAAYSLGWMYENGRGVDKDDAQAAALYRKAADAGNSGAMGSLGVMYEFGRGVAKDEVQAVALYRKSADAGEPIAMTHLGVMYELGRNVAKDQTQGRLEK